MLVAIGESNNDLTSRCSTLDAFNIVLARQNGFVSNYDARSMRLRRANLTDGACGQACSFWILEAREENLLVCAVRLILQIEVLSQQLLFSGIIRTGAHECGCCRGIEFST